MTTAAARMAAEGLAMADRWMIVGATSHGKEYCRSQKNWLKMTCGYP